MREGFSILQGLNDILWVVLALAHVVLAIRLYTSDAWRCHKLLFGLVVTMLGATVVLNLGYDRMSVTGYSRFWLVCYLSICSLAGLALTEACTLSLEGYARFGAIGGRIARAVLIASALAIMAMLFVIPGEMARSFRSYLQAQAYLIQASLALLGLSILAFAHWARLRLGYNARMTIVVLTLVSGMDGLLGSGISASWGSVSFTLGILWSAGCWLYLALRWSSQPDPVRAPLPRADRAEIAPALARMSALNRDLSELIRRG